MLTNTIIHSVNNIFAIIKNSKEVDKKMLPLFKNMRLTKNSAMQIRIEFHFISAN